MNPQMKAEYERAVREYESELLQESIDELMRESDN